MRLIKWLLLGYYQLNRLYRFAVMCLGLLLLAFFLVMTLLGLEAGDLVADKYEITVLEDGTAEITRYEGEAKNLRIPDEVEGHAVSAIGPKVFDSSLRLESVVIPEGVTAIGTSAFSDCDQLTSITLPSTLTTMGDYPFHDCDQLESITLPDSLCTLGANPFQACDSLMQIHLSQEHPFLLVEQGVLFGKEDKRLICYPVALQGNEYTVPQGTRHIAGGAFCGSGLESILLPDSLESIGVSAFEACKRLKSMAIPQGVTVIPMQALRGCTALESIALPGSLTAIDTWAFGHCRKLTEVVIPEGVRTIGNSAFSMCRSLEHVALPQGLVQIDNSAFYYCHRLVRLAIPAGVTDIGRDALTLAPATPKGQELLKAMDKTYDPGMQRLIVVDRGSWAEQWCREQSVAFIYSADGQ